MKGLNLMKNSVDFDDGLRRDLKNSEFKKEFDKYNYQLIDAVDKKITEDGSSR